MSSRKCPCGASSTPDPSCDMCDGWTNNPDTGWGGFTDGFLGRHFDSDEERRRYIEQRDSYEDDEEE